LLLIGTTRLKTTERHSSGASFLKSAPAIAGSFLDCGEGVTPLLP